MKVAAVQNSLLSFQSDVFHRKKDKNTFWTRLRRHSLRTSKVQDSKDQCRWIEEMERGFGAKWKKTSKCRINYFWRLHIYSKGTRKFLKKVQKCRKYDQKNENDHAMKRSIGGNGKHGRRSEKFEETATLANLCFVPEKITLRARYVCFPLNCNKYFKNMKISIF